MLPFRVNSFLWHFSNFTTPSATPGTAEIKASTLMGRAMIRATRPVPAGSTIYARARCSTAPTATYNCTAIGIGG